MNRYTKNGPPGPARVKETITYGEFRVRYTHFMGSACVDHEVEHIIFHVLGIFFSLPSHRNRDNEPNTIILLLVNRS